MKYLVLIAVLVLVYLLWRHQRAQEDDAPAAPPRPAPPPALPQDMVRCPVCAVHLPREEAVADAQGRLYCSPAHRRLGDR